MEEQLALSAALKARLESLRIRFPNYSLRLFAKKAGVSPATMSLLLKSKRRISSKLANSLCEKLRFDPQERAEVMGSALKNSTKNSTEPYIQLRADQYRLISDWKAFAILNLIKTIDFKSETKWIAKRLGITNDEAQETIERLRRLGMLEIKDGTFTRSVSKYRTTEDIANSSLAQSHAQTLELAQRSLETDTVEARDFTWLTLPMDLSRMPKAKALIRKFQDDLSEAIETDAEPTEVYRLAIQFFPLSKLKTPKEKPK